MCKAEQIKKYLETQEKNLEFIKKRIEIQNQPNYTPFKLVQVGSYRHNRNKREPIYVEVRELTYNPIQLDIIQEKIEKAKNYLKNN